MSSHLFGLSKLLIGLAIPLTARLFRQICAAVVAVLIRANLDKLQLAAKLWQVLIVLRLFVRCPFCASGQLFALQTCLDVYGLVNFNQTSRSTSAASDRSGLCRAEPVILPCCSMNCGYLRVIVSQIIFPFFRGC